MALNDTLIRVAKPRESSWKLADEKGLFLLITASGGKLWKLKYRIASKEKKLALGAYPDVGLAAARKLRDAGKATIAAGHDPSLERKKAKFAARLSADVTFASVANEYINTKMVGDRKAPATISKARWFLEQPVPAIGTMPICEPFRRCEILYVTLSRTGATNEVPSLIARPACLMSMTDALGRYPCVLPNCSMPILPSCRLRPR